MIKTTFLKLNGETTIVTNNKNTDNNSNIKVTIQNVRNGETITLT